MDASALLPAVSAATLVVRHRGSPGSDEETARRLASRIPNARLVTLEGALFMPTIERSESDTAIRLIEELLGERSAAAPVAEGSGKAALVTILFTDITDSTALTQRLGDAKAQELLRAHNAIVREALAAHGGSEIKHTGDGIMASFPTASGALECAVAIQRAVEERSQPDLQIHVGVNAGEPVAEERDLFGTAVQLARRICDEADVGEILVSDVVRQLVAGKGFSFADRGEVALKGFEEPVRLYEVRWREEA
jgi:class 3 adenylate cyclase